MAAGLPCAARAALVVALLAGLAAAGGPGSFLCPANKVVRASGDGVRVRECVRARRVLAVHQPTPAVAGRGWRAAPSASRSTPRERRAGAPLPTPRPPLPCSTPPLPQAGWPSLFSDDTTYVVPAGTYSIDRIAPGPGTICIVGAGKGATNIKVPSASASPNSFMISSGGSLGLFNLTFTGFRKTTFPGDFWGNVRLNGSGAHLHAEGVAIRDAGWGDNKRGALDVTLGATASLTDTDFVGCASLRDGGAIFVSAGSSVELHGATAFDGNFAEEKGGAVAAYGPMVFNGPVTVANTYIASTSPYGCVAGRAPAPAGARGARARGPPPRRGGG
jgi:predicted outer membrane repeat protein